MNLEQFNQLPPDEALALLTQCCAAQTWARHVAAAMPFASAEALQSAVARAWELMQEDDWLAAFDAHPKIGDADSLKKKYRNTHAMAAGEQSGVAEASEQTLQQLAQCNRDYLRQFGFIFIVCASGKSAAEMLGLVERRLSNSRAEELEIAAGEQKKITEIRLQKLLQGET